MSSELNYWERTLGPEYAPKLCFELTGSILGVAWESREKEIAGKTYVEFLLVTLIYEGGQIKHFTSFSCPKTHVLRLEPFVRRRKDTSLGDLLRQLHDAFFGGEEKNE